MKHSTRFHLCFGPRCEYPSSSGRTCATNMLRCFTQNNVCDGDQWRRGTEQPFFIHDCR